MTERLEPKKCDIWISDSNPCEISCSTCNKKFASLDLPMIDTVLRDICDAYKQRCEIGLKND